MYIMELSGPKWTLTEDQFIGVCVAGFFFLVWLFWEFYDDRRSNVPKGSLGYVPYVGQTVEFLKNPAEYTARRVKQYGNIFKGCFLGLRAVVSTDPDFSYARDTHGESSFQISMPPNLRAMIGDTYNMSAEQSGLQKLVLRIFLPEGLKAHVKGIDALILDSLAEWEGQTVEVSSACKTITRKISVYMTLGNDPSEKKIRDRIFDLIPIFVEAVESAPIYLPGTLYYKGYQARLKIEKLIARLVKRRRQSSVKKSPEESHSNVLDALMQYETTEKKQLSIKQISDVLCTLFFGGHDTSAAAMTCTIKELCLLPSIRKAAVAQCDAMEERRVFSGPLTLADVRNMRYIQNMLKETLRKYSIVPLTVRQAKEDVDINGNLVPRGWFAVTMASNMHMNPQVWADPEFYKPSRFDKPVNPRTYIPFGVGAHMCPGKSLAEVMISIFFYHLLHKYQWKLEGQIEEPKVKNEAFLPRPVPKEEIRIVLNRRKRKIYAPLSPFSAALLKRVP